MLERITTALRRTPKPPARVPQQMLDSLPPFINLARTRGKDHLNREIMGLVTLGDPKTGQLQICTPEIEVVDVFKGKDRLSFLRTDGKVLTYKNPTKTPIEQFMQAIQGVIDRVTEPLRTQARG